MKPEWLPYFESSHNPQLNEHGKLTVIERFNRLVDVQAISTDGFINFERACQALDEYYQSYRHCYSRFWDIGRLPNALLFGADTLGPDISLDFAALIKDPKSAQQYYEKAQFWVRTHAQNGRNFNAGDSQTALDHGLTDEEIMHAAHPGASLSVTAANRGFGVALSFFKPECMRQLPGIHLFAAPSPVATERILVLWKDPLELAL